MYFIEKFSKKIASKISILLNLDKDQEEVIAYGALNLLHTSLSAITLLFFGALTKSLLEVSVVALTSALLRQYTGGTHAGTPIHCTIISTIIFGTLSQIVKYSLIHENTYLLLLYQLFSFGTTLIIVYKCCPVDSPNKRVEKEETRKKLRAKAFYFLFVLLGLTMVLWFLYTRLSYNNIFVFIACICTGMLWQAISLTRAGRFIITQIEKVLTIVKL